MFSSKYNQLLFLIITICHSSKCETNKCDNIDIQKLCLDQDECDNCLQAHECCNWCYDKNYSGRQCNTRKYLSTCSQDKIEQNHNSNIQIPNEGEEGFLDFTEITEDVDFENIIQIKPQRAGIRLRKGIPVNFTFTYKPAQNYPLDLYYLGDLSVSMADSLKIFKTLGRDLPENLTKLTENYRLAYGTFMDKTGMPFYSENICEDIAADCEDGYLFKHRLKFTNDIDLFTEKIAKSKITANLDDLDGALDAIWQILVCPEQIGWLEKSRKMILLPTDSLLHMAGDGKLVGAVSKPKQICLLDENGNHKEPLKYDFPSIEEIDRLLKDKKVNIIFAVKSKAKENYYKKLTEYLMKDSAYVGELETDSSNIIQLITRGYNNFVNQVSFSVNTSRANYLSVKFYGDCENTGIFNETNVCYGIGSMPINFKVEVSLNNDPISEYDELLIEEKNIQETVSLNITYGGICYCKNYDGPKISCANGLPVCGKCKCEKDWVGEYCDKECISHDINACRMNSSVSKNCFGRGDCGCGKCECEIPFQGKYCEYECPQTNDLICGGPSKGICSDGKCLCTDNFKGKDCSCSVLTDECEIGSLDGFCNNKGKCVCNQCQCYQEYSGKYCEIYKENNTLCEIYKTCFEDDIGNSTSNMTIKPDFKEGNIENICGEIPCHTVTFPGTSRCNINFCYHVGQDEKIHLTASKICTTAAMFTLLSVGIAVFSAIFIGGLVAIIVYKWHIYRADKLEYLKFIKEAKLFNKVNGVNPLYINPMVLYENPLHSE